MDTYKNDDGTYVEAVLVGDSDDFLTLRTRRVLYLLGLAALVVAPILTPTLPEYAAAITTSGNLLGAVGLGTALANPTRG